MSRSAVQARQGPLTINKMKIEVSDYYKDKIKNAYVVVNKEPRRVCVMVYNDGTKHSMSYAKYLYTSHFCCDVPKGEEIDHINGEYAEEEADHKGKGEIVRQPG